MERFELKGTAVNDYKIDVMKKINLYTENDEMEIISVKQKQILNFEHN